MVFKIKFIKGYLLVAYYCSDTFYRACIVNRRGKVFPSDDIYYSLDLAWQKGLDAISSVTQIESTLIEILFNL